MTMRLFSTSVSLTPVQQTSLLVAYWRSLETARSSLQNAPSPSLIQDDFATILVDKLASNENLQQYKSSPFLPIGINCLAIRTRVIDDWLLEGQQRQIVNLGAGMCTRPYRLNLNESTVVYEVDDPSLLRAKRQVLRDAGHEPKVTVVHVAGDVTAMNQLKESLIESGFDPSLPTDWIAEGLLEYLDPAHHLKVFRGAKHLGGNNKESRIVFTKCDPFCRDYVENVMGVNLPWAELRSVSDTVEDMVKAGWSKDVTILDDKDFMRMFQRTITLPIPLILAKAKQDNDLDPRERL